MLEARYGGQKVKVKRKDSTDVGEGTNKTNLDLKQGIEDEGRKMLYKSVKMCYKNVHNCCDHKHGTS